MKKKLVTSKTKKTKEVIVEPPPIKKEVPLNLIRYIIHRFEPNDLTSPTYYIIGFKVICDLNQRETYVETTVPAGECIDKSDNEICLLAYNKLKDKINEVARELSSKKFIVGSEFIPPVS